MTRRIAMLAPLLLAGILPAAADPLADLLARDGGSACFKRVYDGTHLAKNPGQRTRNVLLSLNAFSDGDGAVIRIRFGRSDGAIYIVGSCGFEPSANLDVQGKPLIEAFKGPSGLDCHAMTSADGMSAEEGGDFPVDLRDGAGIVVYMPESLAGWNSFDRSAPADWFDYGKDDATFRVDRTDAGACEEMVEKLPWWK